METENGFRKGARRRARGTHQVRQERSKIVTLRDHAGIIQGADKISETAQWMRDNGLDEEFFIALEKTQK